MIELPKKYRTVLMLDMDQEHETQYQESAACAQSVIRDSLSKAMRAGTEVNTALISAALWKLRFAATVLNASTYLIRGAGS